MRQTWVANCPCRVLLLVLALSACDQGTPPIAATASTKSDAAVSSRDAAVQVVDAGALSVEDASVPPPVAIHYIELPDNDGGTANCIKIVVGSRREKAVLCDEVDETLWRVTHQFVRVRRDGKSVRLLDVPTKIEGFDSGTLMLQQRLRVASDGMSAVTVDVTSTKRPAYGPSMTGVRYPSHALADSCAHSPRPDDDLDRQFGPPTYNQVRREYCDARGAYRWSGDRFELVR